MSLTIELQTFTIGEHIIKLCVPKREEVQTWYERKKSADPNTPFPFWTQVWPAAKALTMFVLENPRYIQDMKVLELAAGLGLPSMAAANYARQVCVSEYL